MGAFVQQWLPASEKHLLNSAFLYWCNLGALTVINNAPAGERTVVNVGTFNPEWNSAMGNRPFMVKRPAHMKQLAPFLKEGNPNNILILVRSNVWGPITDMIRMPSCSENQLPHFQHGWFSQLENRSNLGNICHKERIQIVYYSGRLWPVPAWAWHLFNGVPRLHDVSVKYHSRRQGSTWNGFISWHSVIIIASALNHVSAIQ